MIIGTSIFPGNSATPEMAQLAVRRAVQHAVQACRISMPHYRAATLAALETFADSGDMAPANMLLADGRISEWDRSPKANAVTHALKGIYHETPLADDAAIAATSARRAIEAFAEGRHWSVVVSCCDCAALVASNSHRALARTLGTYGSSESMGAGALAGQSAALAELAALGYVPTRGFS